MIRAVSINDERPQKSPMVSPYGIHYGSLWQVAELCWATSPEDRPTMAEVIRMMVEGEFTGGDAEPEMNDLLEEEDN